MDISWDADKARTNRRKHKVDFADAQTVFYDPRALAFEDRRHHEQRFVTVGYDHLGRLLRVVYTYRGADDARLISAKRANPKERKRYEQR